MSLFWPFSFFNYVVERYVSQLDALLPWFAVALRYSLLLISGTVTILTPFFWFLTIINADANESLKMRVFVSGVHSIWWSLMLCFVGTGALMMVFGLPAIGFDMYMAFGLFPLSVAIGSVVAFMLVVSLVQKRRRQNKEKKKRKKMSGK